ncbi:flavodoxin domain-containing protein [Streptomyces sp. RKAG337]|uniref:flavodoxin domain-containing protein n=1 Tax=Streptomyces sp. RKAG337 TaxID=2893404 RepID=UPI00203337B6|nr:flavodoxin domain-containing protein [Streptomyces sp. RKAG337]MCM2425129.1 flavodoxin domain-containing protein [Streptomyces sp. RKAG337]
MTPTKSQRTLVAYSSKNGSTAEIARLIGETLHEQHIDVEVAPVSDVPSIAAYDTVILGAGLYAGHWPGEAIRFVRHHRQALTEQEVWLFSSGPLDGSATERTIPAVPSVARIAAKLDAHGHVTFGGRLTDGTRGFIARRLRKQGKVGDFRDREQIRAWARDIASELTTVITQA